VEVEAAEGGAGVEGGAQRRRVPTFPTYVRNCDPGACAGVPGLVLPAGFTRSRTDGSSGGGGGGGGSGTAGEGGAGGEQGGAGQGQWVRVPVGLELDGPAHSDAMLLSVGRAVEQVLGLGALPSPC
jgi:mandelamide amidase